MAKTLARIQRTFWWFGMAEEIRHYVKTCDSCQKFKVSKQKPVGLLQPVETTVDPDQNWGVDFHGPLPKGIHGLWFIIFLWTKCTKFVGGKAIKAANSRAIVNFSTEDIGLGYGFPRRITSDGRTPFTSFLA